MFKRYQTTTLAAVFAAAAVTAMPAAAQNAVEVQHWWTSGGEAAALNVLKENLEGQGVGWNDVPVAGGGGESANTVLRARVTAGNPPTAAQLLGFAIIDWAREGQLADLNDLARAENWGAVIPQALQRFAKYDGKWVSAPVNVHSTNWVWANKAIFDELGLSIPRSWNELVAALDAIDAAGYTAIAHGGQAWQEATIFDAVVMATGGPAFYQSALIDLDEDALRSGTMQTVFERMGILRGYVDDNFSGRDWNLASAMVINKQAGMQFMGDWAKGEFLNADKVPDRDFLCFRFPGTAQQVTFNSDQFAMFKVGGNRQDAQEKMASAVLDPAFQSAFNVVKGSVPARTDVSDSAFDACGKKGMKQLAAANNSGNLFGSFAHGHAAPESVKNAGLDVITAHFNGEYDAATAAEEFADAVESAR